MPSSPTHWLEETFTTKRQVEELLRPELENGTLHPRDYELSAAFLPGYHRYYPFLYAGAMAPIPYARSFIRPPKSPRSFAIWTTFFSLGGFMTGQAKRFGAHVDFRRSLQDPQGFAQAMENVNVKLGGLNPVGFNMRQSDPIWGRRSGGKQAQADDTTPQTEGDWVVKSMDDTNPTPPSAKQPQAAPPDKDTSTRWGQIRSAANTAPPSSWEAIRQTNAKAQMQSMKPSSDRAAAPTAAGDDGAPVDDRAGEQARFDALLEAERKMASGSGGGAWT
ncbi:hypothetical protein JAAARDRAFT_29671 [Jaapia argillacea MUCL 33604]|uniref:Uncharacterized protein n=1 Tax=Jaapia argillacea MUCL 33604 TaxID=933084 RepID=A0A067Q9B4_9AGAM|nr:hypothetical protein JAAARDRAFT_29671 [Jaapia argillacea MUCL 33604]